MYQYEASLDVVRQLNECVMDIMREKLLEVRKE
jgi:hypothetical protein